MIDLDSENLVDQIIEYLEDPEKFFSLLSIVDKSGDIVPLVLNHEQQVLLRMWKDSPESRKRLLVLKPRQIGSSTFFTALLFYIWYTSPTPIKICSMAHTADTSKNFMAMFRGYWDNLHPMLKDARTLSVSNTTTMTLDDTGATLLIKTAGAKGGTRSFSFNILHMSELAFYPGVEELMATAIPALNNGDLFIESTPNHWMDGLHTRILQAEKNEGGWLYQFFKWSEHSEYTRTSAQPIILTDYEQTLADLYDLTPEQLLWRREVVLEIGEHKFRRDYPLELTDAYSLGENTWLTDGELGHLVVSTLDTAPVKGEVYAVGVDVALGVGKDYSVIFVVNAKSGAPVHVWESNSVSPTDLAAHIVSIASKYNNAKVLVEVNNHGLATLNELDHLGYRNLWKSDTGDHFMTTVKSKPLLLENLRRNLSKQNIKHLDDRTITQLRALQVKGANQIVLPTSKQGHSDSVMALAMALWCRDSVHIPAPAQVQQTNFYTELAKRTATRQATQHSRY